MTKVFFYVLVMMSPSDYYIISKEEMISKSSCEEKASDVIPHMNALRMIYAEEKKATPFVFSYVCE